MVSVRIAVFNMWKDILVVALPVGPRVVQPYPVLLVGQVIRGRDRGTAAVGIRILKSVGSRLQPVLEAQ